MPVALPLVTRVTPRVAEGPVPVAVNVARPTLLTYNKSKYENLKLIIRLLIAVSYYVRIIIILKYKP